MILHVKLSLGSTSQPLNIVVQMAKAQCRTEASSYPLASQPNRYFSDEDGCERFTRGHGSNIDPFELHYGRTSERDP